MKRFSLLSLLICSFLFAGDGPVGPLSPEELYKVFPVAVGSKLTIDKEFFVEAEYLQANPVFIESKDEFLTERMCGLQMKTLSKNRRQVLPGRSYKVKAVEQHYALPGYRIQSGYVLRLEPEFQGAEDAVVDFMICFKESHEEWAPKSGVSLSYDEFLSLSKEFFSLTAP